LRPGVFQQVIPQILLSSYFTSIEEQLLQHGVVIEQQVMAFPVFRKRRSGASSSAEDDAKVGRMPDGQFDAKRVTKTRRNAIIVTSFCYFVAFIFLILVSTHLDVDTSILAGRC
jgi:hypothetical protein